MLYFPVFRLVMLPAMIAASAFSAWLVLTDLGLNG